MGKERSLRCYNVEFCCEKSKSAEETKVGQLEEERIGKIVSGMLMPDNFKELFLIFSTCLRDYSKRKPDRTVIITISTYLYGRRKGICGGFSTSNKYLDPTKIDVTSTKISPGRARLSCSKMFDELCQHVQESVFLMTYYP